MGVSVKREEGTHPDPVPPNSTPRTGRDARRCCDTRQDDAQLVTGGSHHQPGILPVREPGHGRLPLLAGLSPDRGQVQQILGLAAGVGTAGASGSRPCCRARVTAFDGGTRAPRVPPGVFWKLIRSVLRFTSARTAMPATCLSRTAETAQMTARASACPALKGEACHQCRRLPSQRATGH